MNTQQVVAESDDISVEELEALMADIDADIAEEQVEEELELEALDANIFDIKDGEEIIEGEIIEVEESLLAQAMKAIAVTEAKNEVYEGQTSTDDHIEKKEVVDEKKDKDEPADKKEAKEKTPRATKYTHSRAELVAMKAKPDFYLLETSDLELDEDAQKAKHDELVEKIKSMNVKVGAKCLNLLAASNGTAKLSTFIYQGVRYILSEEKITNADLVAYFMSAARNKTKAYGKSTATPQATNLLRLFTDMKMLNKVGAGYELNKNSLLVETLKAAYGTA